MAVPKLPSNKKANSLNFFWQAHGSLAYLLSNLLLLNVLSPYETKH